MTEQRSAKLDTLHTGVSGFPSLSCTACQSMFHPICVGLVDGVDYSVYDFYCAMCHPPPGKENANPFVHMQRQQGQQQAGAVGGGAPAAVAPGGRRRSSQDRSQVRLAVVDSKYKISWS